MSLLLKTAMNTKTAQSRHSCPKVDATKKQKRIDLSYCNFSSTHWSDAHPSRCKEQVDGCLPEKLVKLSELCLPDAFTAHIKTK